MRQSVARVLRRLCGAVAALLVVTTASAEPTITLKVPPFAPSFPNFASVLLPPSGYSALEIVLQGALGEIQASTVRVTLNGMPMTPFVAVNMMPAGTRAIVRLGVSLSPDYTIRRDGESILTFAATDAGGTSYRGQFYLTIDPGKSEPEIARTTRARAQETGVVAPPQHLPPVIEIKSQWPARTTERTLGLEAEVSDQEGLRRIVIEINGRDVEEILLQNERPVRYQGGRIVRAATAGEVSGTGTSVRLNIPVRLANDRINVIAVRAENLAGLSSRADRAVEVPKR